MISSPFDVYEDMLECDFSEALVVLAFDGHLVFPNIYAHVYPHKDGPARSRFRNIGLARDHSRVEAVEIGRFDRGGELKVPLDFSEDLYYPPKEPETYRGFTMVSVVAKTDDFASFFLFKDDSDEYIEIVSTIWSLWRYVVDSYHYISGDTCTRWEKRAIK